MEILIGATSVARSDSFRSCSEREAAESQRATCRRDAACAGLPYRGQPEVKETTGAFDVGLGEGAVHVHHGSLAKQPLPMQRKALIAVLQSLPKVVYVSCTMAE